MNIYEKPPGVVTRWASSENPGAGKGVGGQANREAKGRPCGRIPAGGSLDLLDVDGSGVVRGIWLTLDDRSPAMLRFLSTNTR